MNRMRKKYSDCARSDECPLTLRFPMTSGLPGCWGTIARKAMADGAKADGLQHVPRRRPKALRGPSPIHAGWAVAPIAPGATLVRGATC